MWGDATGGGASVLDAFDRSIGLVTLVTGPVARYSPVRVITGTSAATGLRDTQEGARIARYHHQIRCKDFRPE
jgi:hypothetical protein